MGKNCLTNHLETVHLPPAVFNDISHRPYRPSFASWKINLDPPDIFTKSLSCMGYPEVIFFSNRQQTVNGIDHSVKAGVMNL